MFLVTNKFEVGEKCFTVYRIPVKYKCPICEGEGKFMHNGYEVKCKNCNGTGKLHDAHTTLLAPVEVKVSSIKTSFNGTNISIRYKVLSTENIRNRSEETMFKTLDEAENYCKCVNTKTLTPEF